MKTHVCLVSAQAAANVLPALDPKLKPEKVILVVSAKMRRQADHLASVLKNNGIVVEQFPLEDEHNYEQNENALLELASRLELDEVSLNITGGTKLMSVAAQAVASASDWPMFYVDADTDRVSWLHPKGIASHTLTEQLRLRHYLQGYGFKLVDKPQRSQATPHQQTLTDTLLRQIGSLEGPLSTLNWLAQQAEIKRRLVTDLDNHQQSNLGLEALLRNFSDAGSLTVKNNQIHFASEADRDFVKGGWLELCVMQSIHALTGRLGIRDKAVGLEVVDESGVMNELDLAFMARNRLFVIECKTARMDRPEAPKANDTLFKLAENCRRLGGVGAKGMLISYRSLRDPERNLARALNIEVVCGTDINRLGERLTTWVGVRTG